jgi:hypothetical protein
MIRRESHAHLGDWPMIVDHDVSIAAEDSRLPFLQARDEAIRRLCDMACGAAGAFWGAGSWSLDELPRWLVATLEEIGRGHSWNPFFLGSYLTTQGFLERLYDGSVGVDQSKAISDVFAWINNALLYGAFRECDELLQQVQVERLPYPVVLSFLTFTFAARDHLKERQPLYMRIWNRIATERGQQAAEQLLKTLT